LQFDDNKIPNPTEPLQTQADPDLPADPADEDTPGPHVSLRDFLDHLAHPRLTQFFNQIGIKTDLDLLDISRWKEGDRNEWLQRFVAGKRIDHFQMEILRLEFMRYPHHGVAQPTRIDLQNFFRRMDDTGLRNTLSDIGIKTERDIKN
jgi:hypothetical protein